ncbi:MAG: hypothetical protein WHS64_02375 [Fervidobacterium sp.]|uniref:Uncharacterized protein n=1 Tax=Fervidobacterium gondwanense DSM 13020 TaxID=1121883 RepID=A0A1M7TCZ7_FERGO|nr:hypothetical protein [Fervidobacterium gondwanense]SHN68610.1 hypothetical protein SAMN02745226_01852 [Fervidobacterium gondwanense DSM 13020]
MTRSIESLIENTISRICGKNSGYMTGLFAKNPFFPSRWLETGSANHQKEYYIQDEFRNTTKGGKLYKNNGHIPFSLYNEVWSSNI